MIHMAMGLMINGEQWRNGIGILGTVDFIYDPAILWMVAKVTPPVEHGVEHPTIR